MNNTVTAWLVDAATWTAFAFWLAGVAYALSLLLFTFGFGCSWTCLLIEH